MDLNNNGQESSDKLKEEGNESNYQSKARTQEGGNMENSQDEDVFYSTQERIVIKSGIASYHSNQGTHNDKLRINVTRDPDTLSDIDVIPRSPMSPG